MKRKQNPWVYGIIVFTLIFIASSVIFNIFDFEVLPSQFFGALIGVVITAIITVFLLKGQTANEMERDKDVKIFEQKIRVYSEFAEGMWGMLDDGSVSDEELKNLRTICFRKLVFYLNSEQINQISAHISAINFENDDTAKKAVGEITNILQKSLDLNKNIRTSDLITLFNSFEKTYSIAQDTKDEEPQLQTDIQATTSLTSNTRYWHFNIFDPNPQLDAFKKGNWVLALIEYGEEWRTNAIRQVKPNDVIFLFKRGGAGYIGAFRALDPTHKILEAGNVYSKEDIATYDIYDGLDDGASLCSNIRVEPIAYNFNGVGYYTVRRRTIERINDIDAVEYLLKRFNGKELKEYQISGHGKLDAETTVSVNNDFFSEIIRQNNLQ